LFVLFTSEHPAAAAEVAQSPLRIRHIPLACVTSTDTPKVEARVSPEPDLEKSYVYFRAKDSGPDYYYTIMEGSPKSLAARLPRPMPETKTIEYYVQAADRAQLISRTPDYAPPVTKGAICAAPSAMVPPAGAGLTIGLTKNGQNPIPPGFNKDDIVQVILVTGAIVTVSYALGMMTAAVPAAAVPVAAGAGAAAGGISTLAIVGIGVGVAGGVAVAAGGGGGSDKPTPTPPPTPSPTPTPRPTPPPLLFATATAGWSGPAMIRLSILKNGTLVKTGDSLCGSQAGRTVPVTLQGAELTSGSYTVNALAVNCANQPTAASVTGVFTVITSDGTSATDKHACSPPIQDLVVGASVKQVCAFTVP
jgi:hypothetical protein